MAGGKTRSKGRSIAAAWALAAATGVGIATWLRARRGDGYGERRGDMSEQNKELSRRVLEDLFGAGRMEIADEALAPEAIGHDPALPEPTRGPEGLKAAATGYRTGFPDLTISVEAQLAEGDSVCTRWTAVGTNTGEFWGIAPTGKQATVTGITIDRIASGKIVESWTNWDALGLMQQLGVVPAATTA